MNRSSSNISYRSRQLTPTPAEWTTNHHLAEHNHLILPIVSTSQLLFPFLLFSSYGLKVTSLSYSFQHATGWNICIGNYFKTVKIISNTISTRLPSNNNSIIIKVQNFLNPSTKILILSTLTYTTPTYVSTRTHHGVFLWMQGKN